ncbi:hypothetical protein GJU39_21120 [Pedobacter petrophilus]|uniref:Uncharacterized protein n=1 Tax=Pedobacter petrophilus TaxID=1908241 RepID=A0A7K0G456_9SPHI|nr:hypothetical protein [Pedobacter petrophilus]MRX78585.1 hypothetical protein [Pedobacter petrophilus]
MNEISNHETYREIITRIKSLSSATPENIFNFEELHELQALAISYELKKYDFTISLTDTRQFSAAG